MFEVIIFVLILSFLVIIHELGHFFAAKWAKIKVEEFGLGYPPRAITLFTWLGTAFSLNWVPFGGFVKMQGEDGPEASSENTDTLEADSKKRSSQKKANTQSSSTHKIGTILHESSQEGPFYSKPAWKRMVVILAGVAVNFIFGVFIFSAVYAFTGIPEPIDTARIGAIVEESPAHMAGLPVNVNIISIITEDEQFSISSNRDVVEAIKGSEGSVVTLVTTGPCERHVCQESAQEFEVYVRTQQEIPQAESEMQQQGALGIIFLPFVTEFYAWYEMPVRGTIVGLQQTYILIVMTLQALQNMLANMATGGPLPEDIAGPFGIVHQAIEYEVFNQGPVMIFHFMGLISVSLAIMNLLPIPALDGGRALFILAEMFVSKKKIQIIEGYANYGGFIFLIGLIILITARDIWRIFA